MAAKRELTDLSLAEIVAGPVIDADEDDVSRVILETLIARRFARSMDLRWGNSGSYCSTMPQARWS